VRIVEIEGVGPEYAAKLEAAGVKTTDDLLDRAAKSGGRKKLAEETGITEKLILKWVNRADLVRIPGVGSEYSDLLEAAGVDSPAELIQRNAANLAATFQELNAARGTVRRIPSEATVAEWIKAAKKLPKVVEH